MHSYGLIGFPLSHSFSKKYFTEKFIREGIANAKFENYEIPSIQHLYGVLENEDLCGLAVTIPYKESVIPFLNDMSPEVKSINACNCIKITNGKLIGYNTDYLGFKGSFQKQMLPHHTDAIILGTGGSSKAVAYALIELGIKYTIVSRNSSNKNLISYKDLSAELMASHQVIINCTPVGTAPNIHEAPEIPYHFLTKKHYLFDLVYNPALTSFLKLGQERGAIIQNGYDMLALQAEENWKIWVQ